MATEKQRADELKKNINAGKRDLKKITSARRDAISGKIVSALNKPNFTTNSKVRDALFNDLAKQYKILNSDINDWTESNANVTAKNFLNYAKEDLPSGAVPMTFGAFSAKYVKEIVGRINPATIGNQVAMNAQIGGMLQRDIQILRSAVSTTIAEGAVEGLTNPEMAARMQKKVKGVVGDLRFLDKAGRRWSADAYFGMLNRTLHANVARDTYIDAATKEAGFDLYTIEGGITEASLRNPSDPCSRWAGKIISMTGSTKGYPTYQDALDDGMFHPNCQHFVRALMPSEIEQAKKDQVAEAKEGAEARKEANKERVEDGKKPAKYAGADNKVATSG